jgi:hypothetical protein
MSSMNAWQLANFGRIDLKPEEFDRAIYQKGAKIIWQKSMFCSCVDETTGQPDYNCPACKGKAYIFFDPKEIRAVVTGLSGDKDQIPIGLLDVGSAYMTTRASDLVGFRDRLTFVDFLTPHSQVITFTDDPEGEELRYECEQVVSVRILSSEIPVDQYSISADKKRILFNPGYLSMGEKFSILYQIKPVYIVVDVPHELRGTYVKFGQPQETWVNLPKQFRIKREDLMPLTRGVV